MHTRIQVPGWATESRGAHRRQLHHEIMEALLDTTIEPQGLRAHELEQ